MFTQPNNSVGFRISCVQTRKRLLHDLLALNESPDTLTFLQTVQALKLNHPMYSLCKAAPPSPICDSWSILWSTQSLQNVNIPSPSYSIYVSCTTSQDSRFILFCLEKYSHLLTAITLRNISWRIRTIVVVTLQQSCPVTMVWNLCNWLLLVFLPKPLIFWRLIFHLIGVLVKTLVDPFLRPLLLWILCDCPTLYPLRSLLRTYHRDFKR